MQSEVVFGKRNLPAARAPRPAALQANPALAASFAPRAELGGGVDVDAVSDHDMEEALGGNWYKFEPLWQGVREECREGRFAPQVALSWPGFFFGAFWLLYRKQYAAFFACIVASMAFKYAVPGQHGLLSLAMSVLIFLFGKWWIVRNTAMTVARIRSLDLPEMAVRARIARQCRPSWTGPIVAFLLLCAVVATVVASGVAQIAEKAKAAHTTQN